MPGCGTHTTIIQHLAQEGGAGGPFRAALGDPTLNADWAGYGTEEALKSRYAVLGALGPDIFYAMLDYGGDIQSFEDALLKVAGTFRCVGQLSGEINNLVDGTVNTITSGVWESIQTTFGYLDGILRNGILDLVVDKHNLWSLFLPLRQVDDYKPNWYWADFLHYVKTGCFTTKLLDLSRTYSSDPRTTGFLKAYSLGWLTHYVADTAGHPYVNRIVESPWRNCWQRHHLVENFIDAYLWDRWHGPSTAVPRPADEQGLDVILDQTVADDPGRMIGDGAPLHYARINDLCNIGYGGVDPTIDAAISSVCASIQDGLFDIGVTSLPALAAPDDPAFVTWTNFMADAMWATYPPTEDHPVKLASSAATGCRDSSGGYPTPDDIAGAYNAYRLVLALATEEEVGPPEFPDIAGDIGAILDQLWNDVQQNLGAVPPPPAISGSGAFSLDALWDAVKSYAEWLGQVAAAVAQTVGDVIAAALQVGGAVVTEPIKVGLWLLNSALYALFHTVRMTLVMSAYSVPLTEDLAGSWGPLDLQTLWKTTAVERGQPYPIEPVLSERDLAADATHPPSPYRPYFRPFKTEPVTVEQPPTVAPPALLAWTTPDDMLERPLGKDVLLSADGPAPPATAPLLNPDGSLNASLMTFDGSKRYFGGIFANCEVALGVAVPYVSGAPLPAGTVLPDYNLDADRGYAWPCWDVDYAGAPQPWNGCDPFPDDTLARVNLPSLTGNVLGILDAQAPISWGEPPPPRPGLQPVDPFGNPRMGQAWVNAAALNAPGECAEADFPFSWVRVDPLDTPDPENPAGTLDDLDPCGVPANPGSPGGLLTYDYRTAPDAYLNGFAAVPDDYIVMPDGRRENDGRLHDFLRAQARLRDPLRILANAVTLSLNGTVTLDGGATHVGPPAPLTVDGNLVAAVAQLAVTGRESYERFAALVPQDADLVAAVDAQNPGAGFAPAALRDTAHGVLDAAYTALWAIRGNDPGWRAFRAQAGWNDPLGVDVTPPHQGWIAVSGFDDTPHRPVNVPTAPYPQYDIAFDVAGYSNPDGTPFGVTTRFLVASAHGFVGPDDPMQSSFTVPAEAADLLRPPAPAAPFSATPAPRAVPRDTPAIPPGNEIILYIHGGGSRAEEAVPLANWLIYEGRRAGHDYTVVSLDLPNSAYAATFQVTDVAGPVYEPSLLRTLIFEEQFVVSFVDALEAQLGDVTGRIAAVMGGSLGGNLSLLLAGGNDAAHQYLNQRGWLKTIVAWSVTATSPSTFLGILSNGLAGAYLAGLKAGATDSESSGTPPRDHATETQYLGKVYNDPLSPGYVGVVPYIPADPVMWFRGADDYQPCKRASIAQSRFDRYEIYSETARHWTNAIDLEQIYFSFQDDCRYATIASAPGSRLLLAAGDGDNFNPNAIYNSTVDVARLIRRTAHGKAEFWSATGHSFHSERPHLFAREIVWFLDHPDAPGSPNGTVAAPQPAPYSRTDQ